MSQLLFRHNLGDKVKDLISGVTGIVTSRSEHMFGCNRYWVEPQDVKDGKPIDGRWFDEESIEVVEAAAVKRPIYARVIVPPASIERDEPMRHAGGPTMQPASASPQNGW